MPNKPAAMIGLLSIKLKRPLLSLWSPSRFVESGPLDSRPPSKPVSNGG
jgi:hypothetical protein